MKNMLHKLKAKLRDYFNSLRKDKYGFIKVEATLIILSLLIGRMSTSWFSHFIAILLFVAFLLVAVFRPVIFNKNENGQ